MLLAIDTSTSLLGLALYNENGLQAELSWLTRARHTTELAPAVQDLLAKTGDSPQTLQVVGVALGPGSFTSLRVGLAFTKGLAMSRNLPLVGIPTLEVSAAQVNVEAGRTLGCVLAAGRGRLALGWFHASLSGWQPAGSPLVTTAEALAAEIQQPTMITGELSATERQALSGNKQVTLLPPALAARRPGVLAELAWQRWQNGQVDAPASLAPIYLHIGEVIPG